MHPVKNKPTQKEIQEHAERKAWNEKAISRLGLTLIKKSDQVKSLTLLQGKFHLHHDWSNHGSQWANFTLHQNLEIFLIKYLAHIESFPGVSETGTREGAKLIDQNVWILNQTDQPH